MEPCPDPPTAGPSRTDEFGPGSSAGGPAAPPSSGTRRLTTEQLLGSASEIEIDHRGAIYRLRITSLDKLILTK